jgi:tRNA threonylcarbamoyladenosine biosynthesis protein TsaE
MQQTYTEDQTSTVARQIVDTLSSFDDKATVLALQGDLGAGKTTLTQSLAQVLGITDPVVSPTFVIAKFYQTHEGTFEHMVHIDAYRIESLDELGPLGWQSIMQQPRTLIVVEWPERIADALPAGTHHFTISHEGAMRSIKSSTI